MGVSRIYLDFDGVLHPRPTVSGPFEHLEAFEALLRAFPDVEVVISSSWRESFPFEDIRDWFAADVQPQVIGVTPSIRGAPRIAEIEADLANRADARYLILDDDASEFPEHCSPLHLCQTATGLTAEDLTFIRAWLTAG